MGSWVWITILVIIVPVVAAILFARPDLKSPLLTLLAFTTCYVKKPFYMEVFFTEYRGVDRGFGITLADLIFLGFFIFILIGGLKEKTIWLPYNSITFLLLIVISTISLSVSMVPYYGLFTLHKLIRGLILYWVVVNAVRSREDVKAIVTGLMTAVVFQGWVVLWDKYVAKSVVNRSIGSFPHPNSLAMYLDLIIPAILGIYLAKGFSKLQGNIAVLAILLGMVSIVFTKSRASLVIMMGALGLTVTASILFKPTVRKMGIVAAGIVAVTILGAIAAPKIIARFEKAPKESEETREYFNEAAHAMASEHFLGVGLNAYSWMLGNTEYYWYVYPDKLDLADPEGFRESVQGQSRLGTAHHIYNLFAAETGYAGMWTFILFLSLFYLKNLWLLFKSKDEYYKAILLGLAVGFATLHVQGLFEWIFRQTQVFYLFILLSGLMVAIGNLLPPGLTFPRARTQAA
jgi:hypothetical protein